MKIKNFFNSIKEFFSHLKSNKSENDRLFTWEQKIIVAFIILIVLAIVISIIAFYSFTFIDNNLKERDILMHEIDHQHELIERLEEDIAELQQENHRLREALGYSIEN